MKVTTVLTAAALLAAIGAAAPAGASTTVYSDRTSFASQLGASVTDDYENPGYVFFQNDAQMSAVVGETTYTATGFTNLDFVPTLPGNDHFYCSGCNGTFQLGFGGTSVSSGGGVFGVGFNLINNLSFDAFVTFADGSTADYALPTGPVFFAPEAFWGITSDLGIASIHVSHNGQPATDGNMGIDNLTIGSAATGAVPEPAAWALMLAGFGAMGGALRRRRRTLAIATA